MLIMLDRVLLKAACSWDEGCGIFSLFPISRLNQTEPATRIPTSEYVKLTILGETFSQHFEIFFP